MARKKKILFCAEPRERIEDVEPNSKRYIVTGRVSFNRTQELFAKDGEVLDYKVKDVVSYLGQDFEIMWVGNKVKCETNYKPDQIFDVRMSRLIMNGVVDYESRAKWEADIKKRLDQIKNTKQSKLELEQITKEEKRIAALAAARKRAKKLEKEAQEYQKKFATGITSLDL